MVIFHSYVSLPEGKTSNFSRTHVACSAAAAAAGAGCAAGAACSEAIKSRNFPDLRYTHSIIQLKMMDFPPKIWPLIKWDIVFSTKLGVPNFGFLGSPFMG